MDTRTVVADAFGKALAAKASPRLLHSLAYLVTGEGRELNPPSTVTLGFAVEGGGPTAALAEKRLAVAASGDHGHPWELEDDREEGAYRLPGRVEAIRRRREAFDDASGEVVRFLRRRLGEPEPELVVRTSWLAGAAQIPLALDVLPQIAEAAAIHSIDAPRLIWREIRRTAPVVRAPAYREVHECAGDNLIIAVLDGEIRTDWNFFGDRVQRRANFTDEPWGSPDDHATAVAGVIGANATTCVGIAPGTTIYNYKLFPSEGPQEEFRGFLALQRAVEDNCAIANCSWGIQGSTDGSSRTIEACDIAWGLNMTVVKSAGNRGPANGSVTSPADARGVIVVGATDVAGTRIATYSSRGPTANGLERPHLVAPGGEQSEPVVSCLASGEIGSCGYGTSLAAPHVTGAIALLLDAEGPMTSEQRLLRLESLCEPLPGHDRHEQGAGILRMTR
jgi:serine protease AprX